MLEVPVVLRVGSPVTRSLRRQQLARELVIRLVLLHRIQQVQVQGVAPPLVAVDLRGSDRVPQQVAEEHRPAIRPFRRFQERVDQPLALVRGGIGEELEHLVLLRYAASQIETDTAEELRVRRQVGERHAGRFSGLLDAVVDAIASRCGGRCAGSRPDGDSHVPRLRDHR